MNATLEKRSLKGGMFLYREGEAATTAYLIQQGSIKIIKTVKDQKREIAVLTTGDIIGERALLPDSVHKASAEISEGGAVVVAIDRKVLMSKYSKTDSMVRNIIESLIQRLDGSNDKYLEDHQ